MRDDDERESHPSYGQISIMRVSSSHATTFYGSHLRHSNFIEVEIKESDVIRSLNADRYYDRNSILRFRMTEAQFATMITSLNMGGGTPITITRRDNQVVPEPTFRDQREKTQLDFENKVKNVTKTLEAALARLEALAAPGAKLSKGELNEAIDGIRTGVREVSNNIPFVADQFELTMDKLVTAAKADIETHLGNAVVRAKQLGVSMEPSGIAMIEGSNDE